jgi:exodeoxyribonuclease VII small subunit
MTEPGADDTVDAAALAEFTYEQAEGELVELIGKLEAGDVPLEDSLQMWERATLLRAVCAQLLTDARARLTAGATGAANGAAATLSSAARPELTDDTALTRTAADGVRAEPPF